MLNRSIVLITETALLYNNRVFLLFVAMSPASLLLNFSASGPIPPCVDKTSGLILVASRLGEGLEFFNTFHYYIYLNGFINKVLHVSKLWLQNFH